ncbi:MAG: peptide deformylase [Bacteroidetes bacterium]|nr:peptide deformylase [Bacteroidota bacterium]MCB0844732.1 peptide deformylase [Bacteroidota bacterium]
MILPIVGYGHPTLKKKAKPITPDYPELEELLENMFETMYNALGVGLAAPQVNLPIRIFVVDGSELEGDGEDMTGFKKVFINPEKIEETGPEWTFEEGCLSIPDIRENVRRPGDIRLRYFDENFHEITEEFGGMKARIIQHEYDHLEGVLFTDHISQLRRSMLKGRLSKISKGDISVDYPMKFPHKK